MKKSRLVSVNATALFQAAELFESLDCHTVTLEIGDSPVPLVLEGHRKGQPPVKLWIKRD